MVQELHVVRCYSCLLFQSHQIRKDKKFCCKMCGAKQSVKKNYGRGSGKDCRIHVQKLNSLQGSLEAEQDLKLEVQLEEQEEEEFLHGDDRVSEDFVDYSHEFDHHDHNQYADVTSGIDEPGIAGTSGTASKWSSFLSDVNSQEDDASGKIKPNSSKRKLSSVKQDDVDYFGTHKNIQSTYKSQWKKPFQSNCSSAEDFISSSMSKKRKAVCPRNDSAIQISDADSFITEESYSLKSQVFGKRNNVSPHSCSQNSSNSEFSVLNDNSSHQKILDSSFLTNTKVQGHSNNVFTAKAMSGTQFETPTIVESKYVPLLELKKSGISSTWHMEVSSENSLPVRVMPANELSHKTLDPIREMTLKTQTQNMNNSDVNVLKPRYAMQTATEFPCDKIHNDYLKCLKRTNCAGVTKYELADEEDINFDLCLP